MLNLMRRFLIVLPPLFLGVSALCAMSTVAWAEDKVVAVVSVQIPQTLAADRAAIEANVAKGMREARWTVLDLADTTRLVGSDKSLLSCTGDVCAVQLVRATKAHYLVWADVVESKRQYAVSLKLFDGRRGTLAMASEYEQFSSAQKVVMRMAYLAEMLGHEAAEILYDLAHADSVPDDERPFVAVVSVKLPTSVQHAQDKAESAVGRGFELAGWDVANVYESTRAIAERKDLEDCTSDACVAEIGRLTKAPYLVFAGLKMGKGKYTVSMSLFDAANASKPLAREEEDCADNDCPLMARKISYAARELGRKAIKLVPKSATPRNILVAATSTTRPALPSSASLNEQPPTHRISLSPEEPKSHTGLRIAGWAAVGAGLALLGGSVFYFRDSGKEAGCEDTTAGRRCFQLYNDKPLGYLLGGVGLASVLVGGYILIFPSRVHPTTVAVTSRGILLGGRF